MSRGFGTEKDQERYKKRLNALLRLPENKHCCECGQRQPQWASVNLGIFFCIRCSGIHRNLGVHISVVRSITLDSWKQEWVDTLEKIGNARGNQYWEHKSPGSRKPDERVSDHVLEQFIRDKYIKGIWKASDSELSDLSSSNSSSTQQPVNKTRITTSQQQQQQQQLRQPQQQQQQQYQQSQPLVSAQQQQQARPNRLAGPNNQTRTTSTASTISQPSIQHDPFESITKQQNQSQQQQSTSSIDLDFDTFFNDSSSTPSTMNSNHATTTQQQQQQQQQRQNNNNQQQQQDDSLDFLFSSPNTFNNNNNNNASQQQQQQQPQQQQQLQQQQLQQQQSNDMFSSLSNQPSSKDKIMSLYAQPPPTAHTQAQQVNPMYSQQSMMYHQPTAYQQHHGQGFMAHQQHYQMHQQHHQQYARTAGMTAVAPNGGMGFHQHQQMSTSSSTPFGQQYSYAAVQSSYNYQNTTGPGGVYNTAPNNQSYDVFDGLMQ